MTYIKRTDVPALTGELVVELDTGALVATSCSCERVATGVAFRAKARAIDAVGAPVLDAEGRPVVTQLSHVAPVSVVDAETPEVISRDCLLAVLGEPVTRPWADVLLSSVSIRVSLAAAPISGPVDAGAVL
ncbi:hypothetical protein ABB27_02455 [Stenotrophomonas terrae]|uniref:Uncharacterized protein n=1 Tax=Stenotrophomonas terrae TaxID=405446 RepID=A0A0R0CP65_9GAMM|nr:hypothetical protein [Stenotrophomonas terrae]KRG71772.1 hypothetical protein ABB27_02455 [Stenotrophomonas terrae]